MPEWYFIGIEIQNLQSSGINRSQKIEIKKPTISSGLLGERWVSNPRPPEPQSGALTNWATITITIRNFRTRLQKYRINSFLQALSPKFCFVWGQPFRVKKAILPEVRLKFWNRIFYNTQLFDCSFDVLIPLCILINIFCKVAKNWKKLLCS